MLLVHGRCGYRRVACFMCYYFYKNITLAFGDVVWTYFNQFSGQIMYPTNLTMAFNALWTSFTAIFTFALDADIPDHVAKSNPYLYYYYYYHYIITIILLHYLSLSLYITIILSLLPLYYHYHYILPLYYHYILPLIMLSLSLYITDLVMCITILSISLYLALCVIKRYD